MKVTSGTCEWITDKSECERAARALGLSDTTATTENMSGYPPYCYKSGWGLYFNENKGSSTGCTSNKVCLCKGKFLELIIILRASKYLAQGPKKEHIQILYSNYLPHPLKGGAGTPI